MRPTYIQQIEKSLRRKDMCKFAKNILSQELVIAKNIVRWIDFYHITNYNDFCGIVDGLFNCQFLANLYKGKYKYFI